MLAEWWNVWRARWRALWRREQLDRDLRDELQFHLAMSAADGGPQAARRRFGNAGLVQETCRELRTFAVVDAFWKDFRFGLRTLWRRPGIAILASVTLALGIGVNTGIFSIANTVLLHPLPYPGSAAI